MTAASPKDTQHTNYTLKGSRTFGAHIQQVRLLVNKQVGAGGVEPVQLLQPMPAAAFMLHGRH